MKIHIDEFVQRFAAETHPLQYHISPESVEHFQKDDRVWPVSIWIKAPGENGTGLLQHWQAYPDPCDPQPGDDSEPLVRNWRIRRMMDCENGTGTVRECPEEIIASCDLSGEPEHILGIMWQIDHDRSLPNMPPPNPIAAPVDDDAFVL